jgi:all-trans-retinol 13,14-reductase
MKPTVSYKQHSIEGPFDGIIIGSGIGGLGLAAILAREGQRILVLERHYTAGGYTHVFRRKGYEWDVGVHYIGEVNRPNSLVRKLFDYVTDGSLEWEDMGDVYDNIRFGDEVFSFRRGTEAFKEGLKEHFPAAEDQRAIDRYVDLVHDVVGSARGFFTEKAVPGPVAALAGPWMRRRLLKHSRMTTLEALQTLTRNPRLIGVLTGQWGDYGLPPSKSSFAMHCMVARHYFKGGCYPIGGSGRILEAIAPVIQDAGGLIVTNAEVASVRVAKGRATGVEMADGRVFEAPRIVSGAGYMNTVRHLLPPEVVERHGMLQDMQKVRPSAAHLCLYLGFKETAQALDLPRANHWIYPEGGYDHDATVERFLENPESEIPLAYVSFPAAKDPDFERRYPGRSTVEVLTVTPWELFAEWQGTRWMKRGPEYEALKAGLSERLLDKLFAVEPQLRGKVDHAELSTPLSTAHFCNYEHGEIYGLDHTPDRFEQRFLKPRTPVKDFYLTGQDIATAGIGGALSASMLTAIAILNRNLTSEIVNHSQ